MTNSDTFEAARTHPVRSGTCLLLTVVALLVHGYHPFAEDAGIYIPAIKKQLDPALYPSNSEFFTLPAHFSLFTHAVAGSTRILHLPVEYVLLLWYLACLFFTILACWRIAALCFRSETVGFVGASLVSVIVSMPAAGCALLLLDPYLTSRSVATPLSLFAIVFLLEGRYLSSILCWLATLVFHPLMAATTGLFLFLVWASGKPEWKRYYAGIVLAGLVAMVGFAKLVPVSVNEEYRAAVESRSYFFLSKWAWYEQVGAIAPLVLFAAMLVRHRRERSAGLFRLSVAAITLGLLAIVAASAFTWVPALFAFARLQPMRAYQLIYLLLILPVTAGLLHVSRNWKLLQREMAFAVLLVCLASGMYFVQRQTFEASAHIEWPWTEPRNAWQRAFEWIRKNTPPDAVFALDANYPDESGNDRQGFRAGAERSALPDESKDGGVVALFPQLAHTWKADTALTTHMSSMSEDQRARLLRAGVTWVVIPAESGIALECPYSNARVSVCRLQHEGYAAKLNPTR